MWVWVCTGVGVMLLLQSFTRYRKTYGPVDVVRLGSMPDNVNLATRVPALWMLEARLTYDPDTVVEAVLNGVALDPLAV